MFEIAIGREYINDMVP